MKKILVKMNPCGDVNSFEIICDCTGMKTYEDALACIMYLYKDVYTDERIHEIATALAEEGEYWENNADGDDDVAFKVIDISNLKNPLAKG